MKSNKIFLALIFVLANLLSFSQLKVLSTGKVAVGAGTSNNAARLNISDTDEATIYSKGFYTFSWGDAIKSEVNRTDAIAFSAYYNDSRNFMVFGNGDMTGGGGGTGYGAQTSFTTPQITVPTLAATYQPFLNNSTWFTANQGFEGYMNSIFTTEKDTTFNGFTYSKIIEKYVGLPGVPNNTGTLGGGKVVYFVREDVPNKKVYKYSRGYGDYLLYDFALEVGASLPHYSEYELKTVDFVEGPDGLRKRFIFKSNKYDDVQTIWIEGIGNISAPFIPYIAIRDWQKLICASQNGIRTYEFVNKDGITCDSFNNPISAITDGNKGLSFSIYPNPTKGIFRIVFNENILSKKTIRLTDMNGKTVSIVGDFEGLDHIDIDISTLPNGLYFCVINSENNTSSFKIVKQ